jgi:hypothetical protein
VSGRDQKVQLGARVPKEIRALAAAEAKAANLSLNVWIEKAIAEKAGRSTLPLPQLPIVADDTVEPGTVEARNGDAVVAKITNVAPSPPAAKLKRFAANCVGGTYHWKYGPGKPCPSCGGEL